MGWRGCRWETNQLTGHSWRWSSNSCGKGAVGKGPRGLKGGDTRNAFLFKSKKYFCTAWIIMVGWIGAVSRWCGVVQMSLLLPLFLFSFSCYRALLHHTIMEWRFPRPVTSMFLSHFHTTYTMHHSREGDSGRS